jgi:uncharacterized protein YprB with RNaseH-like and TPR domain
MELRDRLRTLIDSKNTPHSRSPEKPSSAPLPYLLSENNEFGVTYYNDKIYIDYHGEIDLKNFPNLRLETLKFLALDDSLSDFALDQALFLDIETTGTSGGAGTVAFLAGLGFLDQGFFQIRQFFLHDLAHERAFLHAIAEFSRRFRHLITYNGKCFDSQILRTRYSIHRQGDPLSDKQHIDMLFVARRLWKRKYTDCDLMNLERNVLQFFRKDDIPSFLIPSAYTDYLRFANGSRIQQVLHHNQWDILSLAVLTARACLLPDQDGALSAEEHYSLSMLHERRKNYSSAIEHQLKTLQANSRLHNAALLSLARNLRRVKDEPKMRWLLQQIPEEIDSSLCKQLCIVCEHDLKDPALALRFAVVQLQKLEKFRGLSKNFHEACDEWKRREHRLLRKIARKQASMATDNTGRDHESKELDYRL